MLAHGQAIQHPIETVLFFSSILIHFALAAIRSIFFFLVTPGTNCSYSHTGFEGLVEG